MPVDDNERDARTSSPDSRRRLAHLECRCSAQGHTKPACSRKTRRAARLPELLARPWGRWVWPLRFFASPPSRGFASIAKSSCTKWGAMRVGNLQHTARHGGEGDNPRTHVFTASGVTPGSSRRTTLWAALRCVLLAHGTMKLPRPYSVTRKLASVAHASRSPARGATVCDFAAVPVARLTLDALLCDGPCASTAAVCASRLSDSTVAMPGGSEDGPSLSTAE